MVPTSSPTHFATLQPTCLQRSAGFTRFLTRSAHISWMGNPFSNALLSHTRSTCVFQAERSAPQHQAPSAQHRYVTKVDATNSRHWHATDGSTPKQTTSCCRQSQPLTLPHASQPDCATLLTITPTVLALRGKQGGCLVWT